MSIGKPTSLGSSEQPDYSEIEVVLGNCEQVVRDLTQAHQRYGTLHEDEIAHFDRLASVAEESLREVCKGVLRQEVSLHGGNIEDPTDVLRLRTESAGCVLAYQLLELAAAVGGWGNWPCNAPFEAATTAYVGFRDHCQIEAGRDRKEVERKVKISQTKRVAAERHREARAEAMKPVFAKADEIKRRNPKLSAARVLHLLDGQMPLGTDLPSEKELRNHFKGR